MTRFISIVFQCHCYLLMQAAEHFLIVYIKSENLSSIIWLSILVLNQSVFRVIYVIFCDIRLSIYYQLHVNSHMCLLIEWQTGGAVYTINKSIRIRLPRPRRQSICGGIYSPFLYTNCNSRKL